MTRTQQKRIYKQEIKDIQSLIIATLTDVNPDMNEESKEKSKLVVANLKGELDEAKKKLDMFLMNKTGSKFFEWHPNTSPNRKTRKLYKNHLNKR